jgi:hypothetical protein
MADPTQQQPGLGSQILGGLGQVLPYALPTALGAIMGRGLPGGALGGAAMGAGFAGADIQAQKDKQQELAMEQQRLHIEAQEGDLEVQKGKLALQNEADKKAYAATIKDPTERRMYLDDPATYFTNKQWQNFSGVLAKDPNFKTSNPELAKMLPSLPPEMGQKLLEQSLSGKYQHVLPPTKQPDGTWAAEAIRPDGTVDKIPTGDPTSLVVKETPAAKAAGSDDKANQALRTKAVTALTTEYAKYQAENDKVAAANAKKFSWQTPDPLPHPNLPDSTDDYIASGLDSRVNLLNARGSAPVDPNAKLKGSNVPPTPPKALWGKTNVIGPDGRKWNIDAKGKATPAS